jgi:acyl phosphate:glycerol-3-phosphate acyltransferase
MLAVIGSLFTTAVVAYLWGSLPSGYWMGKVLRGKDFDIRQYGSNKIGATNVQRTLGTGSAIIVLLLDISKGIVPAFLATYISFFQAGGWGILVACLCALIGHCFPVFIAFKGGRGVMTGAGAILVISPLLFAFSALVSASTIALSRYVSLGSIVGGVAMIVGGIFCYTVGQGDPHFFAVINLPQLLAIVMTSLLVIFFHADNIGRLLHGTERKIFRSPQSFSVSSKRIEKGN